MVGTFVAYRDPMDDGGRAADGAPVAQGAAAGEPGAAEGGPAAPPVATADWPRRPDFTLPSVPGAARRVHVAPERLARWLAGFAQRHGTPAVIATSGQLYLRAPDDAQCWIEVPYPPMDVNARDVADALCRHALAPRTVGVVLVRRGGHAAGVFEGTRLVASKVGSSYVQGTTKAGGWSQQRFARRRDNQSRAAFADAADAVVRILLPRAGDLDAVVGGGDRPALDAVLADPRLAPLRRLLTPPFLAVPDPRLRVLEQSSTQLRAVSIQLSP